MRPFTASSELPPETSIKPEAAMGGRRRRRPCSRTLCSWHHMSLARIIRVSSSSTASSRSIPRPFLVRRLSRRCNPSIVRQRGVFSRDSKPFSASAVAVTRMKAILIKDGKGPAGNMYLGEEDTPEPSKGQVQVKVGITRIPVTVLMVCFLACFVSVDQGVSPDRLSPSRSCS